MADETVYEPGPSFVENERPTDRLTEMPGWLQSFAASERGSDNVPDAELEAVPGASSQDAPQAPLVEPDDTLPEWLRTEPAHVEPEPPAEALGGFDDFQQPIGEGPDSFISEDDLPDWLRAFSHESTGRPLPGVSSSICAATTDIHTSATAIRVPPVENVWLSAYDRQVLGPGRTLFALLASSGGVLTDAGNNGTHSEQQDAAAAPSETGNTQTAPAPVAPATRSAPVAARNAVDKPGSSMRLVLLALLVVLVLIFLMLFLI